MDTPTGVADLHTHTMASDGTVGVAQRVSQARNLDLAAIAITDHDVVSDDLTGRWTHRDGVEVVTGVEIRADVLDTKVEILGYYVDPATASLGDVLERVRVYRHDRNEALVENLVEQTGLDLAYEEMVADAGRIVSRPYFAQLLVDRGVVGSIGAAFDEYLGPAGTAYVEMNRLDAGAVIDAIQDAGGVASLAHPGRIRSDAVPETLDYLVERGLDAIEVWYPYDASGGPDAYADVDVEDAAALADEHGLLRTGGSDCHGPGSGKERLGQVRVPEEWFDRLRTRAL